MKTNLRKSCAERGVLDAVILMAALGSLPPDLRGTGAMIELRKRLMQRLQTASPRPQ